jgi:3-phenylpropionate/trans-cinnamate dioxygenase ferredoxin reductase subunit
MNMQVAGAPTTWDRLVYRGDPAGGSFIAFQLLHDVLVGSISVNAGRDMRFARMLIGSGKTVDREALVNTKVKLQDVLR